MSGSGLKHDGRCTLFFSIKVYHMLFLSTVIDKLHSYSEPLELIPYPIRGFLSIGFIMCDRGYRNSHSWFYDISAGARLDLSGKGYDEPVERLSKSDVKNVIQLEISVICQVEQYYICKPPKPSNRSI